MVKISYTQKNMFFRKREREREREREKTSGIVLFHSEIGLCELQTL